VIASIAANPKREPLIPPGAKLRTNVVLIDQSFATLSETDAWRLHREGHIIHDDLHNTVHRNGLISAVIFKNAGVDIERDQEKWGIKHVAALQPFNPGDKPVLASSSGLASMDARVAGAWLKHMQSAGHSKEDEAVIALMSDMKV
jgi:ornithine cyclodeaminase/alanine dehydrogenase-like protein (mu-crystallin family)